MAEQSEELILARQAPGGPPAIHPRSRPSRDAGLLQVRRGAYVEKERWQRSRPAERYLFLVRSTVAAMRSPGVLSHESAAVLLGIPIIGRWPDRVHVTGGGVGGGRSSGLIIRHGVQTMPDVGAVGDVAVTSVPRTVVDLARTRPFASSLASADHALATGMCTADDLFAEVDRIRGLRGYRPARYVVERADPGAQSVGESLSRARMYELGLPMPELQREFFDLDGFVGRVDFWWELLRLIGEFDGRSKYRRGTHPDALPADEVVWQEKRREDRLRPLAAGLVRWTWDIALDRTRFAAVLARAGVVPAR